MAAPSGTSWGSVVTGSNSGQKGKIGIYVKTSSTNTVVKTTVQIWFWTIYSCYDKPIKLKYDAGEDVTSASTTVVTSKDINHTVDTGDGWSTRNQTKLYEYTTSTGWSRYHTQRTINFCASLSDIDMLSGKTMTASKSITIKAKPSYTVSYSANGGSGAPSSQTKWYDESLTLSSTKPTRTGYTFKGWSTSSTATTATWSAGGTYTTNATDTLYAVWKANTYTVSYNANGGSGAPSSQTKTYGKTLTLSSTVPTRTNYNFVGWATSSTATTASYQAGGSYTKNSAATLYAVWELAYSKPRITNISVNRVNTNGQSDDQGTRCKVTFSWATDKAAPTITISYRQTTSANWSDVTLTAQNTSGTVEQILSAEFSIDKSYEVKVTVADSVGSSYVTRTLSSGKFIIDFKAGGDGIAIGKAAENAGFDVYMDTKFEKSVTVNGDFRATGKTTLDGNLTGKYITGTWLQTTAATDLNNTPPKVAVLDNSGWIYSRTPNELKSDMGLATSNITLSVNDNRLKDFSYTAKYVPVIPAVFVRIYGVVNVDMNAGYDYDIINIGSNSPNWQTALSIKSAKNVMAVAKNSGVISIRPLEAGIKNYDVYIAGFWFV